MARLKEEGMTVNPIKDYPIDELLRDLEESAKDIGDCRTCKKLGDVSEYDNKNPGRGVDYRIKTNQKIIDQIKIEIKERIKQCL